VATRNPVTSFDLGATGAIVATRLDRDSGPSGLRELHAKDGGAGDESRSRRIRRRADGVFVEQTYIPRRRLS